MRPVVGIRKSALLRVSWNSVGNGWVLGGLTSRANAQTMRPEVIHWLGIHAGRRLVKWYLPAVEELTHVQGCQPTLEECGKSSISSCLVENFHAGQRGISNSIEIFDDEHHGYGKWNYCAKTNQHSHISIEMLASRTRGKQQFAYKTCGIRFPGLCISSVM